MTFRDMVRRQRFADVRQKRVQLSRAFRAKDYQKARELSDQLEVLLRHMSPADRAALGGDNA